MMLPTSSNARIDARQMRDYFRVLVNMFFKILPMKENGEVSLTVYMQSLQDELLGAGHLIPELGADPMFLSLAFTLQAIMDHPDYTPTRVKREVFRAISVCNKLCSRYADLCAEVVDS